MPYWTAYFIAFISILLFQLIFTLGLGAITRKRSFLYYSGFLLMMCLYNYLRFGEVHQGWMGPEDVLLRVAAIFPFLAYYFYFRFIRDFLDLRQLSPALARLARYLEWGSLAYLPVFFVLMQAEELRVIAYFIIASGLAVGTLVLQLRMLGFRSMLIRLIQWGSLFYFLGMMTGFVSKAMASLQGGDQGRIEIDYMSLGLLAETIFFALALAYKLRQEAQEKQHAQERAFGQLQKIQELGTSLQEVRDKIARDLHDDIGSTLGTISLLGALASEQISPEHPATPLVARMGEYARSMGESMNDAIWALNSHNDKAEALIKHMKDFAAVLLTGAGISFRFDSSERWKAQELSMALRKNVFLIYKESLYNIVRHAQASEVEICLEDNQQGLWMNISDNGKGLADTHSHSGNGLRNMRKRAEESGLQLELVSSEKGGLMVRLGIKGLSRS